MRVKGSCLCKSVKFSFNVKEKCRLTEPELTSNKNNQKYRCYYPVQKSNGLNEASNKSAFEADSLTKIQVGS